MKSTEKELRFMATVCSANKRFKVFGGICLLMLSLNIPEGFAQDAAKPEIYTVKSGDTLQRIASAYSSVGSWRGIYEANRDQIQDPDLIYPGQKLEIPQALTSADSQPGGQDGAPTGKTELPEKKEHKLGAFRKAFEKVVRQQNAKPKPEVPDNGLEFGGLVINETRSKMGADFFNAFYKYWEPPAESNNFMLTIIEQPTPSLGTSITIKIDNQRIFTSRLQPRYAIIERLAKQAVMISFQTLQIRHQTSNELTTY